MPVRELFVQADETEKLRQKANSLESLDITKVNLQKNNFVAFPHQNN